MLLTKVLQYLLIAIVLFRVAALVLLFVEPLAWHVDGNYEFTPTVLRFSSDDVEVEESIEMSDCGTTPADGVVDTNLKDEFNLVLNNDSCEDMTNSYLSYLVGLAVGIAMDLLFAYGIVRQMMGSTVGLFVGRVRTFAIARFATFLVEVVSFGILAHSVSKISDETFSSADFDAGYFIYLTATVLGAVTIIGPKLTVGNVYTAVQM